MYTPEAYRMTLRDYHAPAEYRVNGVVRNIDAWYKAYSIDPKINFSCHQMSAYEYGRLSIEYT